MNQLMLGNNRIFCYKNIELKILVNAAKEYYLYYTSVILDISLQIISPLINIDNFLKYWVMNKIVKNFMLHTYSFSYICKILINFSKYRVMNSILNIL